jgi:hypothetical protein
MTIADVLACFEKDEILGLNEIVEQVQSRRPDEDPESIRKAARRAVKTGRLSNPAPGVFTRGRFF